MGWSDMVGKQVEIAVEGAAFRAVFLGNDPAGIFIGPFSAPVAAPVVVGGAITPTLVQNVFAPAPAAAPLVKPISQVGKGAGMAVQFPAFNQRFLPFGSFQSIDLV